MTRPALAASRGWWGSKVGPDFVASEIVGPNAVADLAGIRFSGDGLKQRLDAGIQPITNALSLRAVLLARRRPLSSAEIAATLRVSRSAATKAIGSAVDLGAMHRKPGYRYMTDPSWGPIASRVVALELKLSNWQGALEQAVAYRTWANSSWVVLGHISSRTAIEAARSRGVGIATLTKDGTFHRLVRPVTRRSLGGAFSGVWAGEQILARAVSAGQVLQGKQATGSDCRSPGLQMPRIRISG